MGEITVKFKWHEDNYSQTPDELVRDLGWWFNVGSVTEIKDLEKENEELKKDNKILRDTLNAMSQ